MTDEETLDPRDWAALRVLGHRALDDAMDYMESLRERPAWEHAPAHVKARFDDLVAYGWNHDLAEIVNSLIGAGLRIEHLHEFPTAPAPFWGWMVQDEKRWWWLPDGEGGRRRDLPLSFSIRATRPAT